MHLPPVASVEELIALTDSGVRPNFLFFWGHTPKIPGQVDPSCLSNWFPAEFTVDGHPYPTTEHFMMAEKARLFGDSVACSRILAATSPGAAKKVGREVSGFDEAIWLKHRFGIVVAGNLAKFSQHGNLAEFLGTTGSKVLVEASPRDRIWGIGMGKEHEHAAHPQHWRGVNLLGFALMEVRARLFPSPP